MDGYQITLYTRQDRRHRGQPMAEWLMRLAAELGLRGATLTAAGEGLGRDRRLHSAQFFELAEQPLAVALVVDGEEAARLFARLDAEGVELFYVKAPVQFGITAAGPGAAL